MATKLKSTPILKTREAVERAVNDCVAAQINREGLVAMRDAAVQEITKKSAPAIDELSETIEANLALLEQWADHNRGEFGDAQSIKINDHRLGYRVGQPTVKPLGKLKFPAIIKMLIGLGGHFAEKYLRVKTELNKDAILETGRTAESGDPAAREVAASELSTIGCEIVQSESFYLEPAREGQAPVLLKGGK